ncbi:MAG: filamentous hemagglutinin N-terminal domain-containing protein, partial [Rhodospirillaceae bacterium]|nr:filamentous hemagglutinin N-terminal domain-containing protein [Rhodospirillaceae bacterium]
MSPRTLLRGTSALTAAAVMASAGWALATPTGGTVVSGSATITQTDPKTIVIRQESDKVIIEWENFDIGKGEHVIFDQPSSLAAALNRVLGGGKTAILGSLTANGQIVITNPKGIVFGPEARVDVASIIATSLGISNANFLSGRMIFDQPGEPGAVVSNAGEITVKEGGLAALVAPGVENSGVIRARLGTVALAAGNAATLDLYGDGLVQLAITAPVKDVPIGPDGQPVKALVRQAGQIFADGGTVVLTAEAAEGVIDRIINVEGIVQARSIESHDGQIAFVGGGGEVRVAGTVDASGQGDGVTGGTVHVLGDRVTLADNASIDVSGAKGGGTVLIGGDAHGGPLVRTAGLGYEAPAADGAGGATVVLSK